MQKYEEIETLGKCIQDNSILVLAQDKQSCKYFMLKKIQLFASANSEDSLLSEAKILKELNHPHILKYYDIVLENDHLLEVLEFCQYGSISSYLQKRKLRNEVLSQKLIISWLMQILMALQYLNQKRIVHRLLTVDNIYMNHQGDLKIGSFGKAKQLECTLQKAQTIVGQPCSLSPQMVQGQQYDSKTDIWSLGCLIYYLTTFEPPYKYGNLLKLYQLIVQQPCPELPLKYSKYLSPLYKKMMRKNPTQRPSASDLLEDQVFSQLMKEYLKKKKIDSIDLKKMQPKPLIVQKKTNLERKSNKIKLQPLISSSRVQVSRQLDKNKRTQTQFSVKTSRVKQNKDIYENQFEEKTSSSNQKVPLPVIKNKSRQYKSSSKLLEPHNRKLNLQEKQPNKVFINQFQSKSKNLGALVSQTPNKMQKVSKDPLTETKKFKANQLSRLIQIKTPEKANQYNILSQSQDKNLDSDKKTSETSRELQKQKEKQYIELLYRVKLEYLQEKYSPNMSKILQQTTQFQSFKDLLTNN